MSSRFLRELICITSGDDDIFKFGALANILEKLLATARAFSRAIPYRLLPYRARLRTNACRNGNTPGKHSAAETALYRRTDEPGRVRANHLARVANRA